MTSLCATITKALKGRAPRHPKSSIPQGQGSGQSKDRPGQESRRLPSNIVTIRPSKRTLHCCLYSPILSRRIHNLQEPDMDSTASSQRVEIMTQRGPVTISLEEFQTLLSHYRQQSLAKQERLQKVNDRWASHYHEGNDHKSSALSQKRVTFNRQSEATSQQQDIPNEHGEGDLSSVSHWCCRFGVC